MAKPELGTKRICPVTGRKFYDLNKNPVISPYTGEVVPIAPIGDFARPRRKPRSPCRSRRAGGRDGGGRGRRIRLARGRRRRGASGKKSKSPDAVDDDIEVEDDGADDDSTFIQEDEEGDDDVTDIIGDGIEKDEET